VSGGYGFASGGYEVRLNQSAVFTVLVGDWDPSEDASTILTTALADNISEPESIDVLCLSFD